MIGRALAAALVLVILASGVVAQALDPSRWPDADRRFLQAALVWSGDYVGLTDGDWGARSDAALDVWLEREAGGRAGTEPEDLRPLALALVDEVWSNDWTIMNLDPGLSVALPVALLGPTAEIEGGLEARSVGDDLVFRVLFDTPAGTAAMHRWMAAAHAGVEEPYQSVRGDRMVSASTLDNGRRVYLRSALLEGFYVSMQVVAEPWQRARLELMASSMQWGQAPELWPAPGGPLDRMLEGPAAPPDALAQTPPGPGPRPALAPPASGLDEAVATGTGFFVNNTDVVTAAHVVEGCSSLALEDGSRLSVIASDAVLDIAVLASARRSATWLPLQDGAGPRLGQPVLALGYPYTGLPEIAQQGLAVTGGNVSALPRAEGPQARVMISAPVQPGNSGGPLLGEDGSVLGVVVSRIGDDYVREMTGTLPQNLNFVTPVDSLVPFLRDAAVLFPSAAAGASTDLRNGVPDAVQAAVVLIRCFDG